MPKAAPGRAAKSSHRRRAIAFDPDRLGMVGGGVTSCIVLVITLVLRHVSPMEAVVRAGIVFVVSYVVTFILVLIIQRITLTEIAQQREAERERILNMSKRTTEPQQGEQE